MEEFFHTFNALYNHQKQIVITSDLPPKQLTGFAERMRSRFGSGLNVDVQPPELETRIAILRKKAQNEILPVRDDVMEYIASHVTANIRELEGALIRASAAASMKKPPEPITLAEAETYLRICSLIPVVRRLRRRWFWRRWRSVLMCPLRICSRSLVPVRSRCASGGDVSSA